MRSGLPSCFDDALGNLLNYFHPPSKTKDMVAFLLCELQAQRAPQRRSRTLERDEVVDRYDGHRRNGAQEAEATSS